MSTVHESCRNADIDQSLDRLADGAKTLERLSIRQRISLIEQCVEGVGAVAREWVQAACDAKRIPLDSPVRTEEVTGGPLATLRFLQLIARTFEDIEAFGTPALPAPVRRIAGQCRAPVFPTRALYDSLLFRPMTAETWLHPDVQADSISAANTSRLVDSNRRSQIVVVLGAGNVSSIPATDALTKIFIENNVVALKMNPVNDYLGPIFQKAFAPLFDSKMLQLIYGGVEAGKRLIESERTRSVHITGSIQSHDDIVWGKGPDREKRRAENHPVLQKTITSELGNISPWAVMPGRYTDSQLRAQAETIATSIVNNVSFNCIATKVILTCRDWPQREPFRQLLNELLDAIPRRYAYYPGAVDRFNQFADCQTKDTEYLPWTILWDIQPENSPHLLQEESFTPVCVEWALNAHSEKAFLHQAVNVMNEQIWGTLAATITVTDDFQRSQADAMDAALRELRYGTIGINQWPAISFALMSTPWGGHPSSNLQNAQSGNDFVHNTFLLERPEKTILRSPLQVRPKPIWNSTHRHPEKVTWDLFELYRAPSAFRLPRLVVSSLTG